MRPRWARVKVGMRCSFQTKVAFRAGELGEVAQLARGLGVAVKAGLAFFAAFLAR